jgi:hypothetical protein
MVSGDFIKTGIEVERSVWRLFKSQVALKGLKIKFAITEALRLWLDKYGR